MVHGYTLTIHCITRQTIFNIVDCSGALKLNEVRDNTDPIISY